MFLESIWFEECWRVIVCWSNKKVWVAQSCLTLCNTMVCSSPGSSVHGTVEARILKWVAIPFFRESSQPRDWTWVSCLAGRFLTSWATRKTPRSNKRKGFVYCVLTEYWVLRLALLYVVSYLILIKLIKVDINIFISGRFIRYPAAVSTALQWQS